MTLPTKQREIDALVTHGEPVTLKSAKVPGLSLVVTAPGVGRYKLRFDAVKGRAQRRAGKHTIGDARIITIGQAEDAARDFLAKLQTSGKDPRADRTGVAFDAVYRSWLADPSRKRRLRPATLAQYEGLYTRHVKARLGSVPIGVLDKSKIGAALEAIRVSTTDDAAGHRGLQATKALKLVKSVVRYALDNDFIERDPTRGIGLPVPELNPDGRQHRPLTKDELRAIWTAMQASLGPKSCRMLQLSLLLGRRVSELCAAERHEIDLAENTWTIPADREGNKSREAYKTPLPPMSRAIFEAALASSTSRYVFPHDSDSERPTPRECEPACNFDPCLWGIGVEI